MKDPDHELDSLLASLRAEPPPPAAARVARELSVRVAARVAADDGLVWFWRWSGVLGLATMGLLGWAGGAALDLSHQLLAQADPALWLLDLSL